MGKKLFFNAGQPTGHGKITKMSIYDYAYSLALKRLRDKEKAAWAQVHLDNPLLNDDRRWKALVDKAANCTEEACRLALKLLAR